jgi:hypothetical protein
MRCSPPRLFALTLLVLTALPGPGRAGDATPYKGTFNFAVIDVVPTPVHGVLLVTGSLDGNEIHLGRFTGEVQYYVDTGTGMFYGTLLKVVARRPARESLPKDRAFPPDRTVDDQLAGRSIPAERLIGDKLHESLPGQFTTTGSFGNFTLTGGTGRFTKATGGRHVRQHVDQLPLHGRRRVRWHDLVRRIRPTALGRAQPRCGKSQIHGRQRSSRVG